MPKTLKGLINTTSSIANGNYFEELNPRDYRFGLNRLATSVIEMQKQLISQMFEMQVVSSQIDTSTSQMKDVLSNQKELSGKIFANSENLSSANKQNYKTVSECVQVSNEMIENTQVLQSSASKLQASSASTKTIITTQLESIANIVEIIGDISETSSTSITYINKLFDSTTKIEEILKTVQNFYKQTQLLALNAAIESARAGEAGNGFAVVANQIRLLAENSSSSVNEISTIIQEIDFDIHKVIDQSAITEKRIEKAVENTTVITNGLHEIEASYYDVEKRVGSMVDKLDTNLHLFNKLSSTIGESETSSEIVAQEIENINKHINNLYEKVDEISSLEVNFKDTSKSLHAITSKGQVDLLGEAKSKINKQAQDLIEKLQKIINNNPDILQNSSKIHKNILDPIIQSSDQMEALWTNDADGSFIYSNPPAGISNATIRDWFKESIQGTIFISDVYISAISKSPCVTISLPIYYENKQIIGVIGADIGVSYM